MVKMDHETHTYVVPGVLSKILQHVCVCVCVCVCVYVCICVHERMDMCVHMCTCVHMYVYVCKLYSCHGRLECI